ncbi:hypothetical protein EIN_056400 [Entamoeba invadens IP1]|uniref:hypothetical protein n=1 Tax=Entamoeba invadens IP1 TaxID=370355 RepID=UPI0002C3DCD5|nr:hypothetical protein EIN_056400 [Entamoeba invadens IP1]ELP93265.1 hypothetical protein EIN_056400 [Entamoeba invadens IP1]|eukprot:XP_004260036.1 hypothetical protein EIN_056400 [Entamoeba invadens IP1]
MFPFDNLFRQLLVAFLYNTSCYFYWIVVPLLFNEQGASALMLALLQTVCFVIYGGLAPFGGKIADYVSPFIMIRISMVMLTIAEVLVAIWQDSIVAIYFSCAFWAFSALTFWPSAVGNVGKEAGEGKEVRNSGLFAVCWSFGKAIGYAAGGTLKSALGSSNSLYIAIGLNVLIAIVYPYRHVKWLRDEIEEQKESQKKEKLDKKEKVSGDKNEIGDVEIELKEKDEKSEDKEKTDTNLNIIETKKPKLKWNEEQLKNKTYIYVGYIMQLGVFGTSCVITNQYIKIADYKNIGIPFGNPQDNFVAFTFFVLYSAQTIAFIVMSLTVAWTYHRSLILAAQAMFLLFLILLVVVFNPYVIFAIAFFAGLAAGFGYQTSTYYSLRASEKSKGLFVGISESVAALSNAFLPLIAGLLSDGFNVFAPVYFCVVTLLLCLIASEVVYHIFFGYNEKRQAKRFDMNNIDVEHGGEPIKEVPQAKTPTDIVITSDVLRQSTLQESKSPIDAVIASDVIKHEEGNTSSN